MRGPARTPCTYEDVDSAAFAASGRFALWRGTGRLPMTAEAANAESRQRFHKLSGPSCRFADLTSTPMKLSRARSHYVGDGLDMVSVTLMLGPSRWSSSSTPAED